MGTTCVAIILSKSISAEFIGTFEETKYMAQHVLVVYSAQGSSRSLQKFQGDKGSGLLDRHWSVVLV